jgi:hypothetical protein
VPDAVFVVIVVAFVVVALVLVRRTQRGAFVERLPTGGDERVLLEEEGLKVAHRFRRVSVRGGWTVTRRVRPIGASCSRPAARRASTSS